MLYLSWMEAKAVPFERPKEVLLDTMLGTADRIPTRSCTGTVRLRILSGFAGETVCLLKPQSKAS